MTEKCLEERLVQKKMDRKTLNTEEKYNRFLDDIEKNGCAYVISRQGEWLLTQGSDGMEYLPIWSEEKSVRKWAEENRCECQKVELEEVIEILQEFEDRELQVAIFNRIVVEVEMLLEDLKDILMHPAFSTDYETECCRDFIVKAGELGCIWGLKSFRGWAICNSAKEKNKKVIPFWTEKSAAKNCATDEWKKYRPCRIAIEEFADSWLGGMEEDGIYTGLDWKANLSGIEVEAGQLLDCFKKQHRGIID